MVYKLYELKSSYSLGTTKTDTGINTAHSNQKSKINNIAI